MVTDTSPCLAPGCAEGYGGGAVFVTADYMRGMGRLSVNNCTLENNAAPVRPLYAHVSFANCLSVCVRVCVCG